jgi:hypothetical protein
VAEPPCFPKGAGYPLDLIPEAVFVELQCDVFGGFLGETAVELLRQIVFPFSPDEVVSAALSLMDTIPSDRDLNLETLFAACQAVPGIPPRLREAPDVATQIL